MKIYVARNTPRTQMHSPMKKRKVGPDRSTIFVPSFVSLCEETGQAPVKPGEGA